MHTPTYQCWEEKNLDSVGFQARITITNTGFVLWMKGIYTDCI